MDDKKIKLEQKRLVDDAVAEFGSVHVAENFAKYVSRQELSRFLFRHDLYKKIIHSKGSIIECGVLSGGGLLSWIKLSDILEPTAFNRQVIGFDTFDGFPSVHSKDASARKAKAGDVAFTGYDDIKNAIAFSDKNALLRPKPKGVLVKGDFMETAAKFLEKNQHLIISLLYLDFDIYDPTKKALELFLPRMHKGSIIGFDEINNPSWPGETLAVLEGLTIRDLTIEKFEYEPHMSYAVLN